MKFIQAYIKPRKLSDVTLALHEVDGLTGMSVIEMKGFGRGRAKNSSHSIKDELIDFIHHIKLEIFCQNEIVGPIVTTIQKAAHTGLRGDGKIYVNDVNEAYRISTGEHGEQAV